jgi:hypothetical protein
VGVVPGVGRFPSEGLLVDRALMAQVFAVEEADFVLPVGRVSLASLQAPPPSSISPQAIGAPTCFEKLHPSIQRLVEHQHSGTERDTR